MKTSTVNLTWKRLCVLFSFVTLFFTQLLVAAPILNCNNINVTISCTTPLDETPKPSVTSNCGSAAEITLTYEDDLSRLDACGHSGIIIRTYTATDACGLISTCVQTITIVNEAPILNCNNLNVTIECDAPRRENDLPRPIVSDDCSDASELTLTFVDNESNLNINNCTGFFTRTWTATDACGLTSTCVQTISIVNESTVDNPLCENIQIEATNNQLSINNITAPNPIVKVFDPNWQLISECSGDCLETITIPNLIAGETYHTDIQFYDENWGFICEDKQDIEVIGGEEPCDTSICQGDVILRTQAEVDAFCGCEVIEGDVFLGEKDGGDLPNSDIINLNTLRTIKVIKGSLVIGRILMENLSGLENLKIIGTTLTTVFNPNLKNFEGLDNLIEINDDFVSIQNSKLENFVGLDKLEKIDDYIYIESNQLLTSLNGFNNLTTINNFQLEKCPSIKSLKGLDNLEKTTDWFIVKQNEGIESVEGIEKLEETGTDFVFVENPNLISISGLERFQKVGRALVMLRNSKLENIDGLSNVKIAQFLEIQENPNLSSCCAINHLIDTDTQNGQVTDTIIIANNLLFCNSIEEILENCQIPPPTCENIQILTENNQIIIQGLTAPNEIVKVFDKDFNIVYQCVANCEDTQMAGTFPVGDYTVDLQLYDENWALICAEQRGVTVTQGNSNPCNGADCETIAPVLANVPADMTVECDDIPNDPTIVTATDNCDDNVDIDFEEVRQNGNCENNYTLTRTWTAFDDCGNSTSRRQVITIIDSTDPILANVPADMTVECDKIPAEPINITAIDNCDSDVTIEFNEERHNGSCQDNYVLTRIWTAIDNCGNLTQGVQTISVIDDMAPVLNNVPADLTFNASDGFDTTFPITTDNCAVNPTLTVEEVINSTETEIVRTFTATDNCGNTSTAQQIITIIPGGNDLCEAIEITTTNGAISFKNIDAPNSIVKVFDANYQIIFDCTATCESELVVPVVGAGIYHTDVQFYDENWNFICEDRQDIEVVVDGEPCDTLICQGDVNLHTQAEMDAFCGCTVIEGNLTIGGPNLTESDINDLSNLKNLKKVHGALGILSTKIPNFNGLNQLTAIGGILYFQRNHHVKNFEGLTSLEKIGGSFYIDANNSLESLNGLDKLDSLVNLSIMGNNKLQKLEGLKNLKMLKGLSISAGSLIKNFDLLEQIENTIISISITGSDYIENLNGLERFDTLGGLFLGGNRILNDVSALKDLQYITGNLLIEQNRQLENCCIIKHLLSGGNRVGGSTNFGANKARSSCDDPIQFDRQCLETLTVCESTRMEIENDSLRISGLIAPIEIVKVFDNNYSTVYECFADCETNINLSDLTTGIYHISINAYGNEWQPICEKVETVQIEANTQDRNTQLLPADFALYPNPAESETFIDLNKLKGESVQLTLFNQFGQKVKQQIVEKVTAQKEKMDITTLQNGVYILQIKAAGKRPIAKKLMVTRLY